MKIVHYRLFLLFTLCTLFLAGCSNRSRVQKRNAKLRTCPDEWIENRMPGPKAKQDRQKPNQYFILDGKRRELQEFDLDWIRNNCDIKEPVIVY